MKIISVTRDEVRDETRETNTLGDFSTYWTVKYKGQIESSFIACRLFMVTFGMELGSKQGNAFLKSITANDLDTDAKKGTFSIQMDWMRCAPVSYAFNN